MMSKKIFISLFIIFGIIKITHASTPKQIRTTNVTDAQIVISWITDVVETCQVNYGISQALGMTAYDVRGKETIDDTHYVRITGLKPETLYYFELISGATIDDNNGMYYRWKTGPDIKRSGLDYAYGKVFKADGVTKATGAIIYFKIKDVDAKGSLGESALWSSLVDENGYWAEDLINIRTQDLKGFFEYSTTGGDKLIIYAQGAGDGTATLTIFTNQDSPAPDIILTTDHTPPSAIDTLEIKHITSKSVTLKWLAPGDDGNQGQAFLYDIRYAKSVINATNFKDAHQVQNEPTPLPANTIQEFEIKNLLPNTTYYFAMKSRDEAGNWSALSNVVSAKTLPRPTSMLDWIGKYNFISDALRLDFGTLGTNFVYMVKYTHPENLPPPKGEPKIVLYKGINPIGTFSTTYITGSFSTGAIYTYSKVFREEGEYSYRFYTEGAGGEPTFLTKGPVVTDIDTGVRITNQTDAQFTVSWVTAQPTTGYVRYGKNINEINKKCYDDRGVEFIGRTHHVTITGLSPNEVYYFDVVSDGVVDDNFGNHYIARTGKSILSSGSDIVYGEVFKQGGEDIAKDAIVYIELKDNDGMGSPFSSAPVSTLVQDNGYWMANLVNFRTIDLTEQFEYSTATDMLFLFVQGADEGIGSKIISTDNDSPALPIELCKDVVAPSSISTLQIINSELGSITLSWYACGDDENIGTAAIYDIRYATFTITEALWGMAEEVKLEPIPAPSATYQEFELGGLKSGTNYYFAIKSIDEVWNISELSNIAKGSTTTQILHSPVLQWVGEVEYVEDGVYPNYGNVDMKFTFKVKYIDMDNDAPKEGEPKVIIYKDGKHIGTYSMKYNVKADFSTGATCTFSIFLPAPATYSYRFFVTDGTGTPTFIQQGPYVTDIPYRETNITGVQFTISWTSTKEEIGKINYSTNPNSLNNIAHDDRGLNYVDDTHHVTITGLKENTLYYYDVISGGIVDDNNGFHYVVKTGPAIIPQPESKLIKGIVYKQGRLEYADGAIVYIQLQDADNEGNLGNSAWASALVTKGEWLYNLVNLRTANLQAFFDEYSDDNDLLYLFAEGACEGTDTQTIHPIDANPTPDMELSCDITPPGTTTLLATDPTATSTTLIWVSAGDDKQLGTPTSYDIRYSKGVIDDDTWIIAKQVDNEPIPMVAGTLRQLIITGLEPTTLYYFGLKTIDEAGNESSLVIATITTKSHPPPVLKWIGEEGYEEDGLEPEKGSIETIFTYQVAYFHKMNFAPQEGFPKIHILKSGNELQDSPYSMQEVDSKDIDYTDGKIYKFIKTFPLAGTYTYYFDAKDTLGVLAQGTPTKESFGPQVGVIPILAWTNEAGYKEDGLEPEAQKPGYLFTYRVNYIHSQNIPPASGYPKVYIYLGNVQIPNSPFTMQPVDPQDADYIDGKLYTYSISLNDAGKYYYSFEAKDKNDFTAIGKPTQLIPGPIVAKAPKLTWVDEEGYKTDGVEPNAGDNRTIFTYKVKYSDEDNTPPDLYYPILYILRGSEVVYKRKMFRSGGNDYVTGVTYIAKLPLIFASQDYSYYFEAKNTQGVLAVGTPTIIHPGPLVDGPNYPPRLLWVGKEGYIFDGLEPETGTFGTTFNYRIKYSDLNADPPMEGYPILYIYKGNTLIGTKAMSYLYGTFISGAVYAATYTFKTTGFYKYRFEAKDKKGAQCYAAFRIGPMVSTAPILEWMGDTGYKSDGLEPEVGTINMTIFTYKIVYKDTDNDPPDPKYPVVHIFRDGKEIYGSPYRMIPIDTNDSAYDDGKGYKFTKSFEEPGSYTYQFEAYDYLRVKACGIPATKISQGPIIKSAPMLSWTYEEGYLNDGVEPEEGTIETIFTYRVNYIDLDGDPPLSNYPVVHILKGGIEIDDSPFMLEEVNPDDTNYKDGKLFTFSCLLPDVGTYSYYFEAYDSLNIQAIGAPTTLHSAPSIIEGPILKWAEEPGYINDGVDPGTGTRYITIFTYKVTYKDPTGNPPAKGYPKVHILRGGAPLYPGGQYMYIKSGNDYQSGVTYSFPIRFPIGGRHYTYYFEAKSNNGIIAKGEPTKEHNGPFVEGPNFKPSLFWTRKEGFISDGIEPNVGTSGTKFTYQICYRDMNGDPPQQGYPLVYIYKDKVLIATATMSFSDGNWAQGANYIYYTTLSEKGKYEYKFKVKDELGEEVTFPAYFLMPGPKITSAPKLEWFGEVGFFNDGVEPEVGTRGTIFTYRVIYFDEDNEAPEIGFPKLQICKDEIEIVYVTMVEANPQDIQYDDGKTYEYFKILTQAGTYTYRFDAKDVNGVLAIGTPTVTHIGPQVISAPFLAWLGIEEFISDGLDPEVGTSGTKFTFKIKYIDLDNLPPGTGSPKVHIFSNHQPYVSFGMQPVDIFDDNYTDGKVYSISISLPPGTYTYKFEAENISGAKATGKPTWWEHPGPKVSTAPVLTWVQQEGFKTCGVYPGTGTKDTIFTYKVEYKDVDNEPPFPLYPKVYILRNGKNLQGSPFKMDEVNPDDDIYSDGKEYEFSTYLPNGINYTYRFVAKDEEGVEAIGTATQWHKGPVVNNIPMLIWANIPGYTEDGLEPEVGTTGTEFVFLIRYKDIDNDPPGTGSPKVHIFKAGRVINGSPFSMMPVNPEEPFVNGKLYRLSIILDENGTYSYRFDAEDIHGSQAIGEPVENVSAGPQISILPTLSWLGQGNYVNSGVSPLLGTIGTKFIYMINYTDLDNDPPLDGFPQVDILMNEVSIKESPFKMQEVNSADIDYTDGKWYKFIKYLPSSGTYSYRFIAKDKRGLLAIGTPTTIKQGPVITGTPILEWVGQEPYKDDGVDPDNGTTMKFFTYQVKYIDINNSPPEFGYPKLFILMEQEIIPPYPNGISMYRKEGFNYQEGVIYSSPPIRLPFASTKYGYYFVAKNSEGKMAVGTPTTYQPGPEVTGNNTRPILLWANQEGYIFDGLEPEAGTSGTKFTYLVIYKDLNGDEPYPGYPIIHIYKGNEPVTSTTMKKESGTFSIGALYSYTIVLEEDGNYKYKFEAKDKYGAEAFPSSPTYFKHGPRIGAPPKLRWLGVGNFQADGLDPETGIAYETIFTYKVEYQDDENDPPALGYPKVHILKEGIEIKNSPFQLEPVDWEDRNYQDGKEYQLHKIFISSSDEYTYYFEAKDTYGISAIGTPTYPMDGPDVTGEPVLAWAKDKPGYMIDGLEPEVGTPGTNFIYRICYLNSNNDPPGTNSPRLHIFKDGVEISNSPFTMLEENTQDKYYEDGKLYYYNISLGLGTYTYRFTAESNRGIPATGTPTFIKEAPKVTLTPVLSWVDRPGYITDGLDPEVGSSTTNFVYRVIYTDTEPPELGYPKVHILKGRKEIEGSPFVMQQTNPADTNYADGKEYEYTIVLTATGRDYEYFFEAKDTIGVFAVGEPTTARPNAPAVTDAPILNWVEEENYYTDGIHPEIGTWGTRFVYKVNYFDANNDLPAQGFPKLHILKAGNEISGSPFTMIEEEPLDKNCVDGKKYYFVKTLSPTGRDYTYFFEAEDAYGIKASGLPTQKIDSPDVSRAPVLSWSGNLGFIEDGVEPELGTRGTKFTYQVKYEDPDNDPPLSGFPKVHIYLGGEPIKNSPFSMSLINNGVYQFKINLACGNYSYFFEAKDDYQISAIGTPTTFKHKPIVTDAPILEWVDETGFKNDGVNPNSGDTNTLFTFKINYIDVNNNRPATGYPKLVIFKKNTVIGTYTMKDVNLDDITYTDGKLFYYCRQFNKSSFEYRHKFIAKDYHGISATGNIQIMHGPIVNNSPTLEWTKESGYYNDGINPNYGTTKDNYTYRIKYIDKDNHKPLPGYPKLYIYSKGVPIKGTPITMNEVDPQDKTYTDGKLYWFSTTFDEGTYTYKFEAKDIHQYQAIGNPTMEQFGPFVSDAPTLQWVDEDGFRTDGVDPNPGQTTDRFTYKILYTDVNNIPPAPGYPKLYLYIAGIFIPPARILLKEGDADNYSEGVVYSIHDIRLPYAGESYSYYFEAKNNNDVEAIGQPTKIHYGPKVEGINSPPLLFWTGEEEYRDGLEPNAASPGTKFTFHVAYMDINVDPPASGYPAVILYKDDKPYGKGTYSMSYLNGNYFKGATYSTTITLTEVGVYKYKFYAKDKKGEEAKGLFTMIRVGPKVSNGPKLEWVGLPGFQSDGLEPHEGIVRETYFTYKVKYSDADGDPPAPGYPKICIINNNTLVGKVRMAVESGDNYKDGKIYFCIFRLAEVSDKYRYYFEAKDTSEILATGPPTSKMPGPNVKPKPPPAPEVNQTLTYLQIFNYPNPHTGKTTICAKTNLSENTQVNMCVEIYSITGELVWREEKCKKVDLNHIAKLEWDGRNVASGVYIYKVTITYNGNTMQKISKMAITR